MTGGENHKQNENETYSGIEHMHSTAAFAMTRATRQPVSVFEAM